MASKTSADNYEYVVLTEADRYTIVQQELRTIEDQLYRASLNPAFGDTSALEERAVKLKTEFNAVKPADPVVDTAAPVA